MGCAQQARAWGLKTFWADKCKGGKVKRNGCGEGRMSARSASSRTQGRQGKGDACRLTRLIAGTGALRRHRVSVLRPY